MVDVKKQYKHTRKHLEVCRVGYANICPMLRLYRSGGQGLYEPNVIVAAPIEPERITKSYHRKWHRGHE